ncbi:MAG: hypothetical protein AAF922_19185 [Pseudomonadota bacterium]
MMNSGAGALAGDVAGLCRMSCDAWRGPPSWGRLWPSAPIACNRNLTPTLAIAPIRGISIGIGTDPPNVSPLFVAGTDVAVILVLTRPRHRIASRPPEATP